MAVKRFEELYDMDDPFYASFIGEYYELPYMDKALKSYAVFKAA
jgi:hypothetical protein